MNKLIVEVLYDTLYIKKQMDIILCDRPEVVALAGVSKHLMAVAMKL